MPPVRPYAGETGITPYRVRGIHVSSTSTFHRLKDPFADADADAMQPGAEAEEKKKAETRAFGKRYVLPRQERMLGSMLNPANAGLLSLTPVPAWCMRRTSFEPCALAFAGAIFSFLLLAR